MSVNVLIFTDCGSKIFMRYAGAYKIASVLREAGYSVQVVDHFLLSGPETITKIIDKFVGEDTLMVCWSTTFMNITDEHSVMAARTPEMFQFQNLKKIVLGASTVLGFADGIPIVPDEFQNIITHIKGINPGTRLVLGGTKADLQAQQGIDAFVVGYGDVAIVEYAKFLEGKNPFFQFKKLNDTQISIENDVKASTYNFVESQITFAESDFIRPGEVLPIEISRGCMFKCKFCYYPLIGRKKNDYTKTEEVLYAELMRNYEDFGTTNYMLSDDTFNESVSKLEFFANLVNRLPFKIEYCTYLRLDLIHRFPEMADLLKESGLKVAMFGLETLNHEAGKAIGKGLHPELSKQTLTWLRETKGWKNNILMSSGFIIGLPFDTPETVNAWASELVSFKYPLDTFNFHALRLNPTDVKIWKSEFEKNYAEYGYHFDKNKSEGWINEHWQFEDARDLAVELHNYALHAGLSPVNGFFAMMLRNYNYSWDDIRLFGWPRFVHEHLFQQTKVQADAYFDKVLAL